MTLLSVMTAGFRRHDSTLCLSTLFENSLTLHPSFLRKAVAVHPYPSWHHKVGNARHPLFFVDHQELLDSPCSAVNSNKIILFN
jgi:hypothetical protein